MICFAMFHLPCTIQVDLNDVNDVDIAFDVVDEVDINKNLLKVDI